MSDSSAKNRFSKIVPLLSYLFVWVLSVIVFLVIHNSRWCFRIQLNILNSSFTNIYVCYIGNNWSLRLFPKCKMVYANNFRCYVYALRICNIQCQKHGNIQSFQSSWFWNDFKRRIYLSCWLRSGNAYQIHKIKKEKQLIFIT